MQILACVCVCVCTCWLNKFFSLFFLINSVCMTWLVEHSMVDKKKFLFVLFGHWRIDRLRSLCVCVCDNRWIWHMSREKKVDVHNNHDDGGQAGETFSFPLSFFFVCKRSICLTRTEKFGWKIKFITDYIIIVCEWNFFF